MKAVAAEVCPVPPCEIAAVPLRLLKVGWLQVGSPPLIPRNWLVPPMGKRARAGVELAKRRSPAVARGVCPSASEPVRLLNPGCKQLAFPPLEIPVAQLLLPH